MKFEINNLARLSRGQDYLAGDIVRGAFLTETTQYEPRFYVELAQESIREHARA
jgi:hypothetical protein